MEKENEFCGYESLDELIKAHEALKAEIKQAKTAVVESAALDGETDLPAYERADWNDKVLAFTKSVPEAKAYAKDVAALIAADGNLAMHPACLERALISVLIAKANEAEASRQAVNVKEMALADPEIKDAVIKEYVASLQKRLPKQITAGGSTVFTPPKAPKTLKEATQLVKQLYK